MITGTLMFLMRRSMREASRLKLQFVLEHLYVSRFSVNTSISITLS